MFVVMLRIGVRTKHVMVALIINLQVICLKTHFLSHFSSFFSLSAHFCAVDSTHAALWASGLTFAFTSAL